MKKTPEINNFIHTNDFAHKQNLMLNKSDIGIFFDIFSLFRGNLSQEKILFNLINFLSLRMGFRGVVIVENMDDGRLRNAASSDESALLQYKMDLFKFEDMFKLEPIVFDRIKLFRNINSCSLYNDPFKNKINEDDVLVIPFFDEMEIEKGWVVLDRHIKENISEKDFLILEFACSMAHNALKGSELNNCTTLQLTRNRFLYEITNLLNSDFDFEDSIGEIIDRLLFSFSYYWVGFWTISDNKTLSLLAQAGQSQIDERRTIPLGREGGVIGIVAANGHFFAVNDLSNSHQIRVLGMDGFSSELAVPIIKNDEIFGVLDIRSDKIYAFDQKARRFARIVANQLAQAIYTKRSFQNSQKELKLRRSIIDVGRITSSILELEVLLKKSLDVLLQTFNYWGAAIYLTDEQSQNLTFAAQTSESNAPQMIKKIKIGKEGICGIAASTRKIINIPDVFQFPFYIEDIKNVKAEIAIPIIKNKKLVGILDVFSNRKNAFSADDEEILELFANNMSVAITNAIYYKKVQDLAIRDGLTGLYNHRHFMESITKEIKLCSRYGKAMSMIMIDIDHFKKFNDEYGHPVGDRILKLIAKTIRNNIRQDIDIPARYGGEEFAIILVETPPNEAFDIAERIRTNFENQNLEDIKLSLSISCGLASYPDNATDYRTLIELADKALYKAKNSGRNKTIQAQK